MRPILHLGVREPHHPRRALCGRRFVSLLRPGALAAPEARLCRTCARRRAWSAITPELAGLVTNRGRDHGPVWSDVPLHSHPEETP